MKRVWALVSPKVGIDTNLLYTCGIVEGDQCDAQDAFQLSPGLDTSDALCSIGVLVWGYLRPWLDPETSFPCQRSQLQIDVKAAWKKPCRTA
jgi:hypothetical protein